MMDRQVLEEVRGRMDTLFGMSADNEESNPKPAETSAPQSTKNDNLLLAEISDPAPLPPTAEVTPLPTAEATLSSTIEAESLPVTEATPLTADDLLPTEAEAKAAAAKGIALAEAGAGKEWQDEAMTHLPPFLRDHVFFISEEASAAAYAAGLPLYREGKAYGAVMQRAAKEGLIEKVVGRQGVSRRRHNSPTPLWRSLIASAEALEKAALAMDPAP